MFRMFRDYAEPSNKAPIDMKPFAGQFFALVNQLSPENLCCDGEIPQREVRKRYNTLMRKWRALEAKAGRRVDESEVYRWFGY